METFDELVRRVKAEMRAEEVEEGIRTAPLTLEDVEAALCQAANACDDWQSNTDDPPKEFAAIEAAIDTALQLCQKAMRAAERSAEPPWDTWEEYRGER